MKTFLIFVHLSLFVLFVPSLTTEDYSEYDEYDMSRKDDVIWSNEAYQECKRFDDQIYDKCVEDHIKPFLSLTCREDPKCVETMNKKENISRAAALSARNLTQCQRDRKLACFSDVVETGEIQAALRKEIEFRCDEDPLCQANRFDEAVMERLIKFWEPCRHPNDSISDMNPSCTLSTADLVEPCIRRADFPECVRSLKDKLTSTMKVLCGDYKEKRCSRIQEKADRFESAALKANYPITKCTHFSCVAPTLKAIRTSGDNEVCTTGYCWNDLGNRNDNALNSLVLKDCNGLVKDINNLHPRCEITTVDYFSSCDINQDFSVYEKCLHEVKESLNTEYNYLCTVVYLHRATRQSLPRRSLPKNNCDYYEEKSNAIEAIAIAAKNLHDCEDFACVEIKRTALNETSEESRKIYCKDENDVAQCENQMNTQFLQLGTLVDDWTPCFANPEHAKCKTTTPKPPKPTVPSAGKSKTPQNAKIQNAEISDNSEIPEEESEEENSSGTSYLSMFSITFIVCLNKYF